MRMVPSNPGDTGTRDPTPETNPAGPRPSLGRAEEAESPALGDTRGEAASQLGFPSLLGPPTR